MRTAGHAVNAGVQIEPGATVDDLAGLDLNRARERVRAEGGNPAIFDTALAWASAAVDAPDRDLGLALAACAAWRAGVVDIRADALRRAASGPPAAIAAALLLDEASRLPAFLAGQASDPFAWPQPLPRWIAQIGGFRGLGGPWLQPPTAFGTLPEPGEFWVVADDAPHRVRADAFGHRVTPLDGEPPVGVPRTGAVLEPVAPHSYLLGIRA